MKIGIITPMEEEKREILSSMQIEKETKIGGQTYTEGVLSNQNIVLTESGIGKVMSSIATTMLIREFGVDLIINTGSAGALDEQLNIGDVVIGTTLGYHDADNTAFGYELGQMPQQPLFFESDAKYEEIFEDIVPDAKKGLIVSGDSFVSGDKKQLIEKNFPQALAVEMESASIAQTAYNFDTPLVVIRSISDKADGTADVTFDDFVVTAGVESAKVLKEFLNRV
ncbi:MAG: 5'-methylthioadenosine/adenosylhomocysteine nucleosidase [Lactobacillaceae bacterium]|jgi:adenosylhomocysteine nucleosidase|nr:5'-methylthioadenosine/adenosylhomocysteine nucleosidase [Lactobacillaceae bacterium]